MYLLHIDKWGPAGWQFLHTVTFTYPSRPDMETKKKIPRFFLSGSRRFTL